MIRRWKTWPGVWHIHLTGWHAKALVFGGLAVGVLVDAASLVFAYVAWREGHRVAALALAVGGPLVLLWIEKALWRALKRAQHEDV